MAGIGFELKKLFKKKGIFHSLRAFGYATVITTGPMLLGIVLILGLMAICAFYGVSRMDRELLICMITYTLLASVTVTSYCSMVVTRFTSDMLFEEREEEVLPSFWGSSVLMMVVGGLLWFIFLIFSGATLSQGVLLYLFFQELVIVWNAMSYLTAIKDYKNMFISFFVAIGLALVLGVVLLWLSCPVTDALLLAVTVGYGVKMVLSTNNWTSLLMLDAGSFSSGAKGMVVSIIVSISILLISAAGIVIVIILVLTRATNRKLRQAAEAEREANLAKTRFMSSMSHDIRTPMNAIVGMTELALAHMGDHPYVKNCLVKVKLSADHLLTLINDILDISQIESGQTKLSPGPVSLPMALGKLAEILAPQIQEKEQTLSLCTEDLRVEYVYADQLRLTQVMLNLLSNASKYTPKGGSIWVSMESKELAEEPGTVQIVYTVRDNGIGMSKEFQQTMYNSFSRENNTPQSKVQGSGLGLSICKQIVDLMGGTIECQSEVDEGTTFTVTAKMPVAVPPKEELASKVAVASVDSLEGLKLLVAEDNDFNWEISHELLKMSGIETVRAVNGQECFDMISAAEEGTYDLILMDIQMPIMNGYQSATAIRASQREYLQKIPIIAVTADAFSEDVRQCLEVGMDAHVSKPIDPQKLLEVIRNIKFQNGGNRT